MQTVTATLVSKSKDNKRAMAIVLGEADGKPYSATRHVERQGRNGPFVGNNPDPNTLPERERAARRVEFAKVTLTYTEQKRTDIKNGADVTPEQIKHAELNVGRAEAMLKVAKDNQAEVEAKFPLKVQFDF